MHLRITTKLTILCLIGTSTIPALASAYFPELDDPTFKLSDENRNPRFRFADFYRRDEISGQLIGKAKSLMSAGNYEEALGLSLRAKKIANNKYQPRIGLIKCLTKLHRYKEALLIANGMIDGFNNYPVMLKIDIQKEMGAYEEALKTCDQIEQRYDFDPDRYTARIGVLLAEGEKDKAIKAAREAYFTCMRNGIDTKTIVSQLKSFDVAVPETIPFNNFDNQKIINNIKTITNLKPLVRKDLEALYKCEFRAASLDKKKVMEWRSNHPKAFFWQIIYRRNYDPYDSLGVYLNLDRSDVTKSEIEKEFGTLTELEGVVGKTHHAYKPDRYDIIFEFNGYGKLCSYALRIPVKSRKMAKLTNAPFLTLDDIKHDLDQKHYRIAVDKITDNWIVFAEFPGIAANYKKYLSAKQFLIEAYHGLDRDDIARYIERAPCRFLRDDFSLRRSYTDLPTSAEYASHDWTAQGTVANALSGDYMLSVEGYGSVLIPHYTKGFKDLYALIGPLDGKTKKRIPVIPPEIIDAVDFELK